VQRVWQYRAVPLLKRTRFRRHRQTLPRRGEKRIVWVEGSLWWLLEWRAYRGWWALKRGRFVAGEPVILNDYPRPEEYRPMKRRRSPGEELVIPILSRETKLLAKLPRLCEFLTATSYDDNTFRTPGYLTLRNRLTTFELTLYDPDAGLRLALRAVALDDVLMLAEKAVDADGMPWEVDNYLTEQAGKKKKIKR